MRKQPLKIGDIVRLNSLVNYKDSKVDDVYSSSDSDIHKIDMTITDIISVKNSKSPNNVSKVKALYVCTFLNGNYTTHGFPFQALTKMEPKSKENIHLN